MNPRRLLLPSLSTWLWLLFFLGLSLSSWRLVLINADSDPSFHWRIGNWMIEHGQVIRTDQFSHTRFGAPLISKEWLSEILFAAAGNLLGWNGIVLLSAALIATTMWLLHRQLLSENNEILLSTALVMVAAYACSVHWLARPHLVTQLFAVVFGWELHEFQHGRRSWKRLFGLLVPLMLLWTNLHGAFLTGFVLIGIYATGSAVEMFVGTDERRSGAGLKVVVLAWLLTACLLVSFLNPNGWKLHLQVLNFLRTPVLAEMTGEFRSPNFHQGGSAGFLWELFVLALMFLVARPRLNTTEILVVAVWGWFALHSVRNVPIFALVVTPILATHLGEFLSRCGDSRWWRLYRNVSQNIATLDRSASGWIPVLFAVGVLISVIAWPVVSKSRPLISTEILTNRFPVAAVDRFLKSDEAGKVLHGEMFNDYGWGGYLILALPERKVFIDGRNDFYGVELVKEFNVADDPGPGWEAVFEKYNVGWTILPRRHPLCSLLALRTTDWKRLYADDVAEIYVHSSTNRPD